MPNINELFFEVQNLELLAKQVVEGFIIGLHKSPFHGFSVEFAEHRIYNTGEPIKNIDWKVFGRTDKLFVKRFEEETNLRCQLIIDASSSMYYPVADKKTNKISKIQFCTVAAASLMYLLKKQRDAFGLSIFDNQVKFNSSAKSSTTHQKLLQLEIEKLAIKPTVAALTNAPFCLHQIAETIHKRSLVIIFTDFLQNQSKDGLNDLFSALQHLKYNKHEVIVFDVRDKNYEMDFKFENRPFEFVDIETGEKLKLHTNQVKEKYVAEMANYKKAIQQQCINFKIDLIEADINLPISQVLIPYLLKRTKMKV
jgi:uncharacterized protein (DUF58 family)